MVQATYDKIKLEVDGIRETVYIDRGTRTLPAEVAKKKLEQPSDVRTDMGTIDEQEHILLPDVSEKLISRNE